MLINGGLVKVPEPFAGLCGRLSFYIRGQILPDRMYSPYDGSQVVGITSQRNEIRKKVCRQKKIAEGSIDLCLVGIGHGLAAQHIIKKKHGIYHLGSQLACHFRQLRSEPAFVVMLLIFL